MSGSSEGSGNRSYQHSDATPKRTGRRLASGVATVRVDDRQGGNDQVAIHVEHPSLPGGTRCFFRRRGMDTARSIRSHLRTELPADLARVEVIDQAGVGLRESELLPRGMARSRPGAPATEVALHG